LEKRKIKKKNRLSKDLRIRSEKATTKNGEDEKRD